MFKAVEVKALPNYRIWLRYGDGMEGEADLSRFAGRGVFKRWDDAAFFDQVHIGPGGAIAWDDEIDLCPDTLYMEISGKRPEEVFPNLKTERVDA